MNEESAARLEERAGVHDDAAQRLRGLGKDREADYEHGLAENYREQARLVREMTKLIAEIEAKEKSRRT
jgi:hypothetical protein